MKTLYFKDGEYHFDHSADASVLINERCIIHSPCERNDVWRNKIYDDRVEICTRGKDWDRDDYCVKIDGIGITSGFSQGYWGRWDFKYFNSIQLTQFLNTIEKKGIDYVLEQYKNQIQEAFDRSVEMMKIIEPHLPELKIVGTQARNQLVDETLEAVSKYNLLNEKLMEIAGIRS